MKFILIFLIFIAGCGTGSADVLNPSSSPNPAPLADQKIVNFWEDTDNQANLDFRSINTSNPNTFTGQIMISNVAECVCQASLSPTTSGSQYGTGTFAFSSCTETIKYCVMWNKSGTYQIQGSTITMCISGGSCINYQYFASSQVDFPAP